MITEPEIEVLKWAVEMAARSIGGEDPDSYAELEANLNHAKRVVETLESTLPLQVDPQRVGIEHQTGIYVRAWHAGRVMSTDIIHLEKDSVLRWLRNQGGSNPLAERTVLILLGYAPQ